MLLKNRVKNGEIAPVFFYTDSAHEAKFLEATIGMNGNAEFKEGLTKMLPLTLQLEKAAKI